MNRKRLSRTLLLFASSSFLFGCKDNTMMGITLDEATERLELAIAEQNDFKVELTNYSFSSYLEEHIGEGWNKRKIRSSYVEVSYTAPYRIDDEKTPYILDFYSSVQRIHEEDNNKTVRVIKDANDQIIIDDGVEKRPYSPTKDSSLTSFINLPSLINSNNVEALSLCFQWISSIATPTTPNKTNTLTSFEALGDKDGTFTLTFTGESLPINHIYADENTLPANAIITSLSINCSNNRIDSYSSRYSFVETNEELGITEEEIEGNISVSFTYGAR